MNEKELKVCEFSPELMFCRSDKVGVGKEALRHEGRNRAGMQGSAVPECNLRAER